MYVVVVDAREADAELGETQRPEVAPLLGIHIAEAGQVHAKLVGIVARPVIGGLLEVVQQPRRDGELMVAIDAHARRIDADGGHVASYRAQGVAHAQGLGRALVEGLRKETGIIGALREGRRNAEQGKNYGDDSLHINEKDYLLN